MPTLHQRSVDYLKNVETVLLLHPEEHEPYLETGVWMAHCLGGGPFAKALVSAVIIWSLFRILSQS